MHNLFLKSKTEKQKKRHRAGPGGETVRVPARRTAVSLILAVSFLLTISPAGVQARQGDSGYEGGISSGETPSMTNLSSSSKYEFDYQEPFFLTGVPVILKGKLTLTKKLKEDTKTKSQVLTSTYVYSLKNGTQDTLTRSLTFVTTITPKANGQKVESTQLTKATENAKVGGAVYIISSIADYELTKSILNDMKPAVNYFQGEIISRKKYRMGTTGSDYVTVNSTASYTGYDQYWSSAEAQLINQEIVQQRAGKAPVTVGNIKMEVSTTTKKELKYYENLPEQSSIQGGYVQTQANENVLKYTAVLSELDKKKLPTTKLVPYAGDLKLESFPSSTRLVSPNLNQIRGHASEENIALLFGLEAFENAEAFDPQEYISRAEFVDAFLKVAPEVPLDPAFKAKTTPSRTTKNTVVTSPFADVSVNRGDFESISNALKRGVISGNGKSKFRPDDLITVSEAVAMMVNTLGLNSLAPNPVPVTGFKDNDKIPSYARAPMYVAEKIGLISGDAKGYIYPNDRITKAKYADMMKAYIDYMGKDIRKEYMEKLISY
ncbi:S-layer protein precursor [Ruminiclostridium hungatei]|uniref:S-layer protein n=1 Tax=Ruminiclostridium hungatei TaxID=48256 RepID=A0A1V4SNK9_RUMHU|nr:S-layer homology domain-containing protein [Ruminiclostridium hungatei]OPX44831.1 S-layer protein precursor [Ruminiclostridium hungatei]